jgi:Mrp family chromosome partitioning ATPase
MPFSANHNGRSPERELAHAPEMDIARAPERELAHGPERETSSAPRQDVSSAQERVLGHEAERERLRASERRQRRASDGDLSRGSERKLSRATEQKLFREIPGVADVVWSVLSRVRADDRPARLVFTAAEPRSGTSVLAAATAIGLVRHVRVPVCLIETDVAKPCIAGYLGLKSAGLSDVLDGRLELDECIQTPEEFPDLHVLTAGTPRRKVAGELATERMREILDEMAKRATYVILDTPSVLDHIETRVLARHADGALLVLRAGETRMDVASRAHRILVEAGVHVLGSIFNAQRSTRAERKAAQPFPLGELARTAAVRSPAPPVIADPETNGAGIASELALAAAAPASESAVVLDGDVMPVAQHRREMDLLERRISKLTQSLTETEAALRRIAAAKNIDLGLSSIYRNVQGLTAEDSSFRAKKDLLRRIFQSNLELQHAIQRGA